MVRKIFTIIALPGAKTGKTGKTGKENSARARRARAKELELAGLDIDLDLDGHVQKPLGPHRVHPRRSERW